MLALFAVFALGRLPSAAVPVLVAASVWGLVAIRLLLERRRVGLQVPPPQRLMLWAATLGGIVLVGATLFWVGADRLGSNVGVGMVVVGGFLMILAVTAPAFKLIDVILRRLGRLIRRIVNRISG